MQLKFKITPEQIKNLYEFQKRKSNGTPLFTHQTNNMDWFHNFDKETQDNMLSCFNQALQNHKIFDKDVIKIMELKFKITPEQIKNLYEFQKNTPQHQPNNLDWFHDLDQETQDDIVSFLKVSICVTGTYNEDVVKGMEKIFGITRQQIYNLFVYFQKINILYMGRGYKVVQNIPPNVTQLTRMTIGYANEKGESIEKTTSERYTWSFEADKTGTDAISSIVTSFTHQTEIEQTYPVSDGERVISIMTYYGIIEKTGKGIQYMNHNDIKIETVDNEKLINESELEKREKFDDFVTLCGIVEPFNKSGKGQWAANEILVFDESNNMDWFHNFDKETQDNILLCFKQALESREVFGKDVIEFMELNFKITPEQIKNLYEFQKQEIILDDLQGAWIDSNQNTLIVEDENVRMNNEVLTIKKKDGKFVIGPNGEWILIKKEPDQLTWFNGEKKKKQHWKLICKMYKVPDNVYSARHPILKNCNDAIIELEENDTFTIIAKNEKSRGYLELTVRLLKNKQINEVFTFWTKKKGFHKDFQWIKGDQQVEQDDQHLEHENQHFDQNDREFEQQCRDQDTEQHDQDTEQDHDQEWEQDDDQEWEQDDDQKFEQGDSNK